MPTSAGGAGNNGSLQLVPRADWLLEAGRAGEEAAKGEASPYTGGWSLLVMWGGCFPEVLGNGSCTGGRVRGAV